MILFCVMPVIYIISAIGTYRYIRISHSKGGIHEHWPLDMDDITATFFPLANTLHLISWFWNPRKIAKKDLNKFFKVKK